MKYKHECGRAGLLPEADLPNSDENPELPGQVVAFVDDEGRMQVHGVMSLDEAKSWLLAMPPQALATMFDVHAPIDYEVIKQAMIKKLKDATNSKH